jgi:glutathione synthase/RimK-type ligase-like ATP-grasp enzyme
MINGVNRVRVLPYSSKSKSAKAIAEQLEGKRIKLSGSEFHGSIGDLVINWGHSKPFPFTYDRPFNLPAIFIFNRPEDIEQVADKLSFFTMFEGSDWLPPFWTDAEDIPDEAFPIVCRTVLKGHSGDGIVIANCRDDLVLAPLYVKYIKKQEEYRVHILQNEPFLIQQKKRRLDHANPNWQVRNHANGFIYARENVTPPTGVVDSALDCFERTGLDFGAVDVIWNAQQQKAYVLEINTAPGLEGSTLDDYVEAFRKVIDV